MAGGPAPAGHRLSNTMPYYWRLSGFYLCYFAVLGTLVPYWGLYLKADGFSATEIGLLMAVPQITKLGAPNLWGWLADRTGQRLRVIRGGNFAAALAFISVFFVDGFWAMLAVLACFSFFWNAVLAQFEVITLSALGEHSHRYALVRLWGSVGFILAVLGLGAALDHFPVALVPWALLSLLWLLWLCTLAIPSLPARPATQRKGTSMLAMLRRRDVQVFLLCAFLMQFSHGPYYTFYTIYLDELGISRSHAGMLWALGVIAEVGLFLLMPRLLAGHSLRRLLVGSLALAALRWLLIGTLAEQMAVLVFAQLLHAASFGSFHATAIAWVHRHFGGSHAGQGQALYASFGFGAGWAVGASLAGVMWAQLGAHSYLIAAAAAALGSLLALRWLRD